jgi:hypothetical protein
VSLPGELLKMGDKPLAVTVIMCRVESVAQRNAEAYVASGQPMLLISLHHFRHLLTCSSIIIVKFNVPSKLHSYTFQRPRILGPSGNVKAPSSGQFENLPNALIRFG